MIGSGEMDELKSRLGLFGRALWHVKHNPVNPQSKVADARRAAFESPSTLAWIQTLRELRPEQAARRPHAVKLLQKALCILTGTNNVERWLHELSMQELKSRAHKMKAQVLEATIKLNVQGLTGRRPGSNFDPAVLVASQADSQAKGVMYRASKYGLRCQNTYREFFGERRLKSRSLDPALAASRASDKPRLGVGARKRRGNTLTAVLKRHRSSMSDAVAAFTAGSRSGLLPQSSSSSTDPVATWATLAEAVSEVAAARSQIAAGESAQQVPAGKMSQKLEQSAKGSAMEHDVKQQQTTAVHPATRISAAPVPAQTKQHSKPVPETDTMKKQDIISKPSEHQQGEDKGHKDKDKKDK